MLPGCGPLPSETVEWPVPTPSCVTFICGCGVHLVKLPYALVPPLCETQPQVWCQLVNCPYALVPHTPLCEPHLQVWCQVFSWAYLLGGYRALELQQLPIACFLINTAMVRKRERIESVQVTG